MKLLYTLRTAAAQIALPLAIAAALVPTSTSAQSGAEEPAVGSQEWWAEFRIKAAARDVALEKVMLSRAMDQAMKDYGDSEFAKALPTFLEVQSGTDFSATTAQFLLGQMHESGYGVVANEDEAIRYYKLAAAGGSDGGWPVAHYNLGNIYYDKLSYADAAQEFGSFVNNTGGDEKSKAEARYKLGMLYKNGNGVTKDYALAGKEFATAANIGAGHNKARYEMGMLYLKGDGVGQDFTTAAGYFQKASFYNEAAEQSGDPEAQFALSKLYGMGKGVVQSDADAVKYLRMAARDDHTKAQFGMGVMYATGKGVPQSMEIAYLWIARAAEGDASFRRFSATTQTIIAKTNGVAEAVEARDTIRIRMTAEQIAQGKVLVDRCIDNRLACSWGE